MDKSPPGTLRPALFDLFGEIPVTQREVAIWLAKVPKFAYTRRPQAVEGYIRGYNVVDKIRRFKADGKWHQVIPHELCDHCGQLLAQELAPIAAPPVALEELALLRRRVSVLEVLIRPGQNVRSLTPWALQAEA
jgi:hypothetical protein